MSDLPADSNAVLEPGSAGLTLTLPPTGVWRGSKGLLLGGLVCCGFMAALTAIRFFTEDQGGMPQPLLAFDLAFWAIGIGMLVAAINMGRRRTIIDVVGTTLLITRQSLFGTKQQEWTRDEIAVIRVGRSGTKVGNRPVMNLQIHLQGGKKVGLLAERRDDELEWIAALLRHALAAASDEVSSSGFKGSG